MSVPAVNMLIFDFIIFRGVAKWNKDCSVRSARAWFVEMRLDDLADNNVVILHYNNEALRSLDGRRLQGQTLPCA
jgi:hypothetical protein